ncbi:hypothetical protein R3X25_05390 [Lutibacter sp. TH_r2]|uniref:hypothetical protein n=1 Tax=Lutibacter sp. TH_r2 TaxID=3082083 RepID=UPI0029546821|nr:hypothetical protein [Lutibacter sp. TH_r2]MDV7186708.1 hypothetical protein [Lutibacter sp. TH_r2]
MNLSKEQITYIDDYLKHHNIKYWDVRIELLDHIVTKVEALINEGKDFDKALEEVHLSFGNSLKRFWNSGIEYGILENGVGYENLMDAKRREINKKYRRLLFQEIKTFFTTPKTILISVLLFAVLYYTFIIFKIKALEISIFISLILFSVSIYLVPIKHWFQKKREKSINLQFASNYMLISMMFTNFFGIMKPEGDSSLLTVEQFDWFVVTMLFLYFITNYCGAQVYKRTFDYYNNLYEKLQQL